MKRLSRSLLKIKSLRDLTAVQLVTETVTEWLDDGAGRLSAALAYYTIFSLAPLLIFVIAIAGAFFGEGAARQEIISELGDLLGPQGATYVGTLLDSASKPSSSLIAATLGFVILIYGATSAFAQLQEALNIIWGVKTRRNGIAYFIRKRLLSFSLVLVIGFLLLVSLVLSAAIAAMGRFISGVLPAYLILANILNFMLSFALTTLLFAAIYRILPDAKVRWRDVTWGAVVASLLFSVGRYLIGLYLGKSAIGSVYGAAGSFVIILMWIYLSAQILFFGAEFAQVWSRRYGPGIQPGRHAKALEAEGSEATAP
ncbi:MAG: YihY/virulence factor BrkB family protein [bacterium]|nr:YihY/virulence factor BrkB family protein [bacterium]